MAEIFLFLSVSFEEPILYGVPILRGLTISYFVLNAPLAIAIASLTDAFSFCSLIMPTKSICSYSNACLRMSCNCLILTPPYFSPCLEVSIKLFGSGRFLLSKLLPGWVSREAFSCSCLYLLAASFFYVVVQSGQMCLNAFAIFSFKFWVDVYWEEFYVYSGDSSGLTPANIAWRFNSFYKSCRRFNSPCKPWMKSFILSHSRHFLRICSGVCGRC